MWFILSFTTAVFTSFKDVMGKKLVGKVDAYVTAWAWPSFTLPFLYTLLFFEGVPQINASFYKVAIISNIILTLACVLFFRSIQISDLSKSIPMLTFTPLFLLITSPIILGEFPTPLGLLGVVFIVGGSYAINFDASHQGVLAPFKNIIKEKGPRYMLIVAVLYSIGANCDKIGVLNSSPLFWLVTLSSMLFFTLGFLMILKSKNYVAQIKSNWKFMLLMGFFTSIAWICQMNAVKLTIVPYVIAVKRSSVIMSALFGFFLFKEKGFRHRILGVVLMVIGAGLILFF